MSDLQISLLIIGAVVVGAVYLFNIFQERRLRRRLENAFATEHEDVLLDPPGRAAATDEPQRLEPRLSLDGANGVDAAEDEDGGAPSTVADSRAAAPARTADAPAFQDIPGFDSMLDCIVRMYVSEPVSEGFLGELLGRLSVLGRPVRALGYDEGTGHWEPLDGAEPGRYQMLAFAMQTVSRSGMAKPAQLCAFCDLLRDRASRVSAAIDLPDMESTLENARRLDDFCAEVDVAIGVNVVANRGESFAGTKIRGLAEAAGFKLEPEGVFHYRNEQRQTLFTLDNHEPAPFIPEQIKSLSTTGVTLLLDVPRVAGGLQALDLMLEVGKSLEQGLGGRLVDDNRVALNPPGISKIRQQLGALHAKMDAAGISAGSERALRLFS